MVSEADNKFTWVIKDFSSLQSEEIYFSDSFLIGGCKWCLTAYPDLIKSGRVYLFLDVADPESLPHGWRRHAKFSLKVVHHFSEKSCILLKAYQWWFDQKKPLCFIKDLPLAKLHSKDGGFLANNELKIVAEVDVLEVIGKSDDASEAVQPMKKKSKMNDYGTRMGNEIVDVSGFQVSKSQVASVRCIFKKHPDLASKVRSNNQHLKSSYMTVLLGLIETLCQLPEKLSDDDLDEASAAVSYITNVGFKVDWLEMKLEEVKEKKKKMNIGKARLRHREEELQNLTKKCADLKDLVEKENADLSAANVAFSFDDVV